MKRVFITAGATGIGKAMAEAFSQAGARVWVSDKDEAALSRLPDRFSKSLVDVADEGAMRDAFQAIDATWGGVDVVCANAGNAGPTSALGEIALDAWRACVGVNLEGAFLTAKYASSLMKRQKSGAIIFTSSTAGIYGYPNRAPYAAAKWGIIGLMKTVAMELGPSGIRANAICPGAVEGARMEGVLERESALKGISRDALYDGYRAGTSMRRFVEAQDVANMAVFLGSDAARLISGQVIAVDGHTENPDPKV